ncbi:hypothetical protein BDZ97DRAFT_1706486 [Flammula alnicola]|nr:hypothetical protein BDZ97DRAFT_1706486 [Flammula alnicola]
MQLYLTSYDPSNSSYCTQDGKVVYKVLRLWEEPPPTLDDYNKAASESELGAGLTKIAEIDFHTISSTIIHHMGNNWKASDFFRKEGWSWYGRDRIFTGPDGKEYAWKMGPTVSELFLVPTDPKAEHTLVARFRTPHVGIIHETRLPSLEIFPAGEDMVDLILTTFIYNEDTMIP